MARLFALALLITALAGCTGSDDSAVGDFGVDVGQTDLEIASALRIANAAEMGPDGGLASLSGTGDMTMTVPDEATVTSDITMQMWLHSDDATSLWMQQVMDTPDGAMEMDMEVLCRDGVGTMRMAMDGEEQPVQDTEQNGPCQVAMGDTSVALEGMLSFFAPTGIPSFDYRSAAVDGNTITATYETDINMFGIQGTFAGTDTYVGGELMSMQLAMTMTMDQGDQSMDMDLQMDMKLTWTQRMASNDWNSPMDA